MRDAGLRRRLVPRARSNPEPQGHRAHRGNGLGDDPDPGVELGYLGVLCGHAVRLSGLCRRCHARGGRRRRHRDRAGAPPRPPPPPSRRRLGGPGSPVPTPASSSADLPSTSGSAVSRRPIRPRSLSTSTTVTSISSPWLRTSSTVPDPLARLHVGDVKQAVGALAELDEGAEVGGLDHLAGRVAVADLGVLGHRGDPVRAVHRPSRRWARRGAPCRRRRRRSRPRTRPRGRGSSRRPCRSGPRSSRGRS